MTLLSINMHNIHLFKVKFICHSFTLSPKFHWYKKWGLLTCKNSYTISEAENLGGQGGLEPPHFLIRGG